MNALSSPDISGLNIIMSLYLGKPYNGILTVLANIITNKMSLHLKNFFEFDYETLWTHY